MKYIIDKNNIYIGFGGSKTELKDGQKEVPFPPNRDMIKAFWNGEGYDEVGISEVIVPTEVPLWKLRTTLTMMGLTNQIETVLNDLLEPQRTAALAIWNHGNTVERYSNTVLFLQSQLKMSDDELDEIFINANKIEL